MKFIEANEIIKSQVLVPNNMSAADLAMSDTFNDQVKAHCFFSAQVTSVNVIEALRREVEAFTAGEMDLATARTRFKSFLQRQGVYNADVNDKSLSEISSTRRIDMIFDINSKQAAATARYHYDMNPIMKEIYPNFIYDALSDARPAHGQYDQLVLPKDDPFWLTHTPPWDYGCRCTVYSSDEPVNAMIHHPEDSHKPSKLFYNGLSKELLPNKSGYNFRIDESFKTLDLSLINSQSLQAVVLDRLMAYAAENGFKLEQLESGRYTVILPEDS